MLSFLKKKLIKHQKESLQELNLSQQYYGNTRRNTPAPDSIKKALSKINLRSVLIISLKNPLWANSRISLRTLNFKVLILICPRNNRF